MPSLTQNSMAHVAGFQTLGVALLHLVKSWNKEHSKMLSDFFHPEVETIFDFEFKVIGVELERFTTLKSDPFGRISCNKPRYTL